jgi:hypothetical protein
MLSDRAREGLTAVDQGRPLSRHIKYLPEAFYHIAGAESSTLYPWKPVRL